MPLLQALSVDLSRRVQHACVLVVGACVMLGWVAGCGPDSASSEESESSVLPNGLVVHLDPRLEDGQPSFEQMQGETRIVTDWEPAFEGDELVGMDGWEARNARVFTSLTGPGVRIHLAEYSVERNLTHAVLFHEGELDADQVDAFEFVAQLPVTGQALLSWFSEELGAPQTVNTATGEGLCTTRFELAGHPGWKGKVSRVQLRPADRGNQTFDLIHMRLLAGGLQEGAEPDPELGDVGLLGLTGDLRRTWISVPGMELFAAVDAVPAGARLAVEMGMPRMPAGVEAVRIEVHGRRESGGWFPVAEERLTAALDHWQAVGADLSEYAEQAVQLRFRALCESSPGQEEPADAGAGRKIWWGAPRLDCAAQPANPGARPHLILVTLDTLRRDYVGVYGGPVATPHLDALADEGLRFDDAWAAANSTLPSHASILSGLDVPSHGVTSNRATLAAGVRTLAQVLRTRGYHTAAAVSIHHLQAAYSGLGRGFDRFLDVQGGGSFNGGMTLLGVDRWLKDWKDSAPGPVFLWVHLFDPHTPYIPPGNFLVQYREGLAASGVELPAPVLDVPTIPDIRWREPGEFLAPVNNSAFVEFLYGASVAYTDFLVGNLRKGLEEGPLGTNAVWAVTADHGESLGEGDIWYDHSGLFPPSLRVPLLLRVPGGPQGTVDARVSNVELARTLLDLAGPGLAAGQPGADLETYGGNLLELVGSEEDEPRSVHFVEVDFNSVGMTQGPHYLIAKRDAFRNYLPMYFDSSADPNCEVDIVRKKPVLGKRYFERTMDWLKQRSTGTVQRADVSADQEAQLQALGYGGDEDDDEDDDEKEGQE